MEKTDFAIVGAGVIGLTIALEIKARWPQKTVTIFEKEPSQCVHASGRNSGVIHAGFYYSTDSLKAKLTRDGNLQLREFCSKNGVKVVQCGKVVVAKNYEESLTVRKLHEQGLSNGVDVSIISEQELQKLEPAARTHEIALWSPNTAVASPLAVGEALYQNALQSGIKIQFKSRVENLEDGNFTVNGAKFHFQHLVNCAGLYADQIADPFGFKDDYEIIPFKGLYLYSDAANELIHRHIYPVPDPRNPFLGVHFTKTVEGKTKIGPTAIPVLSRENYQRLENLIPSEFLEITISMSKFFRSKHHDVPNLLRTELPKLFRSQLVKGASQLIEGLDMSSFRVRGKSGLRAQLFNKNSRKLEMDFIIKGDDRSTHILNAVSPAWTSSFAFAKYAVDEYISKAMN